MGQRLTFDYDRLLFCGPLTDRKIRKYTASGYYGKEAQERLQDRDRKRNTIHKARRDLTIYD